MYIPCANRTLVAGVHVKVLGAKVAPLKAVHWPQVALFPLGQPNAVQVLQTSMDLLSHMLVCAQATCQLQMVVARG
jgi:hypothetical protein